MTEAAATELIKRLGSWREEQSATEGAGHRLGDLTWPPLTCARLLPVYQGLINGGTVKGCFKGRG